MKIEIGESLLYSWLRHEKKCQLVQMNWKASPAWELKHVGEVENVINKVGAFFSREYAYDLFKKSRSVRQIIRQAEVDVVGVCLAERGGKITAVDVAFHKDGLGYGKSRKETVEKVMSKLVKTAMCIYGYFDTKEAEIVFASPKIPPKVLLDLQQATEQVKHILNESGFSFQIELIANEDFCDKVLEPILKYSKDVADTGELFMRSYQLYNMFSGEKSPGS